MNPIPTLTAFLAGALVGGAIADSTEAFALLFGLGVTGGAFLGALIAWLTHYEPDWGRATSLGTLIGGCAGALLAILDVAIGG